MHRPRRDATPWLYADYLPTVLKGCFSRRAMDAFFARRRLFFVLSTGRCGTVLMGDLLNQADGATTLHEPVWLDYVALKGAYQSSRKARAYIARYRRRKIYDLARRFPENAIYGETTFMLSFFADALRSVFPQCRFVHLARDGRDVVRSLINRGYYQPGEDDGMQYRSLSPLPDSPFFERWAGMDQFERCCWRWMETNALILRTEAPVARFEEILTDYGAFEEQMAGPLELSISRETWQAATRVRRNPSAQILFPHWRDWSPRQTAAFYEIAGEVMEKVGYNHGG